MLLRKKIQDPKRSEPQVFSPTLLDVQEMIEEFALRVEEYEAEQKATAAALDAIEDSVEVGGHSCELNNITKLDSTPVLQLIQPNPIANSSRAIPNREALKTNPKSSKQTNQKLNPKAKIPPAVCKEMIRFSVLAVLPRSHRRPPLLRLLRRLRRRWPPPRSS